MARNGIMTILLKHNIGGALHLPASIDIMEDVLNFLGYGEYEVSYERVLVS